jgi:hypothetical protein
VCRDGNPLSDSVMGILLARRNDTHILPLLSKPKASRTYG